MAVKHVNGTDAGKVMLFALSTCVWCRKTRAVLDDLGVAYDYEYVDLLEGDERTAAMKKVQQRNPGGTFPTLLIGDECIVGFQEDAIKRALGL